MPSSTNHPARPASPALPARSEAAAVPMAVSVQRAAELLDCGIRSIWKLLAAGELQRIQVGRAVRIPVKSIENYISRGGSC